MAERKKTWNEWVALNPNADFDFSNVDFTAIEEIRDLSSISFSGYNFPEGYVNFGNAYFGNKNVFFRETNFGAGPVRFDGANFGDKFVNFEDAVFGAGDVTFAEATFGGSSITFERATFGSGQVNFRNANFGGGTVSFYETTFGNCNVDFYKATFGDGYVDFGCTTFGSGWIKFEGATFGKCHVDFTKAILGNGDISFRHSIFGDSDVVFYGTDFGTGNADYSYAKFGVGNINFIDAKFAHGRLSFQGIQTGGGFIEFQPDELSSIRELDFSNSTIEPKFNISYLVSPAVLNLQNTVISHPVDLDKSNINFVWTYNHFKFKRARDPGDSTSFRRLKKLAQEAGDHDRVLDFYAKETRCAYWHSITGLKLALFYIYDWLSDYGRSILRPAIVLFGSWILYAIAYLGMTYNDDATLKSALQFSYGHTFLIYPGTRESRQDAILNLFGDKIANAPWWIPATSFSQYIISSALIFLILLALRNRFRT